MLRVVAQPAHLKGEASGFGPMGDCCHSMVPRTSYGATVYRLDRSHSQLTVLGPLLGMTLAIRF
jgi:hypothetical protein